MLKRWTFPTLIISQLSLCNAISVENDKINSIIPKSYLAGSQLKKKSKYWHTLRKNEH